MKRVLNLVDDFRMGGIKTLLSDLAESSLSQQYDWHVRTVNSRKPVLLERNWDIVIVHFSCAWSKLPWLALMRIMHPSLHIILQEHHYTQSFERDQVPSKRRFRTLLKLTYALANQVVCVSYAQADWLYRNNIVAREKVTVIPPCRDFSSLLQIPDKKINNNKVVLGAIGRFVPAKGFDVLIQAMRLLPKNKFSLRIAGSGPEEQQLRELAADCKNIEFVGSVDNPADFLNTCDLLVMPSRFEPFGMVCAEARAAGLPVVVSDADGLPEQVSGCGAIAPVDNPEALADVISRLVKSNLMPQLGKNARASMWGAWAYHMNCWQRLLTGG